MISARVYIRERAPSRMPRKTFIDGLYAVGYKQLDLYSGIGGASAIRNRGKMTSREESTRADGAAGKKLSNENVFQAHTREDGI